MSDLGYLYVLANSAMPGMVKVGKTTRSPAERAVELSGATGLPTPFIVVYEQLFEDCGDAELFVHTYLEQKGYRVSGNREFFSVPANIVSKAIALAPGAIDDEFLSVDEALENDLLLSNGGADELDDLYLTQPNIYPWSSLLDEAEEHYYGLGDCIQDYSEALRLFRQAAKLGALPAYGYIGTMFKDGEGVRQDEQKALEYYKEGTRKGSVYCYWAMGRLFQDKSQEENANKCFALFIKNLADEVKDTHRLTTLELSNVFADCLSIIKAQIENNIAVPNVLTGFIAQHVLNIADKAKTWLEFRRSGKASFMTEDMYGDVIRYLMSVCNNEDARSTLLNDRRELLMH